MKIFYYALFFAISSLGLIFLVKEKNILEKKSPAHALLQAPLPLTKGKTYSPAAAKISLDLLLQTMFKPDAKPFLDPESFAANESRKQFYDYYTTYKNLTKLEGQHIDSLVSTDYEKLNKFFEQRGYAIRFNPFGKNEVGIATDITIELEKLKPGTTTSMSYQDKTYSAAKFTIDSERINDTFVNSIEVFSSKDYPEPIFVIRAKQQNYVEVLVMKTEETLHDTAITAYATMQKLLKTGTYEPSPNYQELIVPKFICNDEADLQFLSGAILKSNMQTYAIAQAIQQIKVLFTEKESIAKIGTGISIVKTAAPMPKPVYLMNKPFHYLILYYDQELNDAAELLAKGVPVLYASISDSEWGNYTKASKET